MRPLEGVRVLAVENFIAGPYGSMLLADHGADVVKIEHPRGDTYRSAAPRFESGGAQMSYSFLRVNRNKQSIVLDLATPEDREQFLALVTDADVVWENLRPGAFERLGLGWDVLQQRNSRIIYASVSGFGSKDVLPSPYGDRVAFDIVAQALSGMMYRIGESDEPPMLVGAPVADIVAGMLAAFGVSLALNARTLSGRGQRVDVSLYDAMIALNEQSIGYFSAFGLTPPRGVSPTSSPYDVFESLDGWIVIGVSSDEIWQRLCATIGSRTLATDEDLTYGIDRVKHFETRIRPVIEDWTKQRTAESIVEALTRAHIPAAKVQDVDDLFECPHVKAREMLIELHDPVIGRYSVAGNPIKLSDSVNIPSSTAPQLGADQDHYLKSRSTRSGTI